MLFGVWMWHPIIKIWNLCHITVKSLIQENNIFFRNNSSRINYCSNFISDYFIELSWFFITSSFWTCFYIIIDTWIILAPLRRGRPMTLMNKIWFFFFQSYRNSHWNQYCRNLFGITFYPHTLLPKHCYKWLKLGSNFQILVNRS